MDDTDSGVEQRPSICFVAPKAYGFLTGRTDVPQGGGAEVQQVLLGSELHRRGYRVSFVTWDYGQPDGIEHHGVRVFRMCRPKAGLSGVRFLYPRWTSLWCALRRADAGVYYQRTAGAETGEVALWCWLNGRRFVFAAATDPDCDPRTPHLQDMRSRLLFRYGLIRADRVITQSQVQSEMLRHRGIAATLIRSCGRVSAVTGEPIATAGELPRVLWLGRFAEVKRLHLLLDLAESCPQYVFDLVGKHDAHSAYARQIRARAERIGNVKLLGWIPNNRVGEQYLRARVLLCTSDFEGFPNTFIEAWAHGIPVVSTIDPDGIVERHGVGVVGRDVPSLKAGLMQITQSNHTWAQYSERARRYFLENHTVDAVAAAYEKLLSGFAPGRRRPGRLVPNEVAG